MHIAQRKELDVHKTKQKRDKNRTTTSLDLDSSMQSGRWEFRQNQRIWLRLSSVFESRRISFFKIFLVAVSDIFVHFFCDFNCALFLHPNQEQLVAVNRRLVLVQRLCNEVSEVFIDGTFKCGAKNFLKYTIYMEYAMGSMYLFVFVLLPRKSI